MQVSEWNHRELVSHYDGANMQHTSKTFEPEYTAEDDTTFDQERMELSLRFNRIVSRIGNTTLSSLNLDLADIDPVETFEYKEDCGVYWSKATAIIEQLVQCSDTSILQSLPEKYQYLILEQWSNHINESGHIDQSTEKRMVRHAAMGYRLDRTGDDSWYPAIPS
jgi:hypothetical protein